MLEVGLGLVIINLPAKTLKTLERSSKLPNALRYAISFAAPAVRTAKGSRSLQS